MTEVYVSVQGESTWAGLPCVFIRLTGCNLRCTWCDSEFTFTGGEYRSIDDVLEEVAALGIPLVEVTGGEPLAHHQAIPLMQRLIDAGHTVLLETSGSLPIASVPEGVHIIMDLKPPDSGEVEANRMENIDDLKATDEVKFVLASRRPACAHKSQRNTYAYRIRATPSRILVSTCPPPSSAPQSSPRTPPLRSSGSAASCPTACRDWAAGPAAG